MFIHMSRWKDVNGESADRVLNTVRAVLFELIRRLRSVRVSLFPGVSFGLFLLLKQPKRRLMMAMVVY